MNSKRGAVNFEVEGEQFTLRLTTNALVEYQDAQGETAFDGIQALSNGGIDFKRLRALVWCGLTPRKSLEDVGDLIDDMGFETAAERIGDAFTAMMPEVKEQAGKGGSEGNGKKASKAT